MYHLLWLQVTTCYLPNEKPEWQHSSAPAQPTDTDILLAPPGKLPLCFRAAVICFDLWILQHWSSIKRSLRRQLFQWHEKGNSWNKKGEGKKRWLVIVWNNPFHFSARRKHASERRCLYFHLCLNIEGLIGALCPSFVLQHSYSWFTPLLVWGEWGSSAWDIV